MAKTNKCRFIEKHGISQFVMYSIKGQQLNDRDVYTINNQGIEGLLQFGVVRKGSKFELIFNLNGLISLGDFLINPLNRESFARILQNILDVLKGMQTIYFNQKCLLMNFEQVMINPATQRLQFIYVPIQGYDGGCELRNFLLDIIQRSSFMKEEDTNYVTEYIRILNDGINFSIFELEEYIKGLVSEVGYRLEKTIACFKCGTQVNAGSNFCPVCGAKVGKSTEDMSNTIYDPLKNSEKSIVEQRKQTDEIEHRERRIEKSVERQRNAETQGLSTKVTDDYEPGTMLLGMYESMYEPEIYLIRDKTGEKIVISKDSFRLGKSASKCDYAVLDNPMISRIHADIVKQKQGYSIIDLNSTNKTYVDNCVVTKQEEIRSGNKIKLANELFTFYVEE